MAKKNGNNNVSFTPKTALVVSLVFAIIGTVSMVVSFAAAPSGKGNNKTTIAGTVLPAEITAPADVAVTATGLVPDALLDDKNVVTAVYAQPTSAVCGGSVSSTGLVGWHQATVDTNGQLNDSVRISSNAKPESYQDCYDIIVYQSDHTKVNIRTLNYTVLGQVRVTNGN